VKETSKCNARTEHQASYVCLSNLWCSLNWQMIEFDRFSLWLIRVAIYEWNLQCTQQSGKM